MAIKYLLEYKDIINTDWSVSIDIPDYTGEPIPILGVGKDVLSIDWLSQTSDDPHAQHVIPSTAKLQVYSQELDLTELMLTPDLTYRVVINRAGVLFWQGWLSSEGIQKSRQSVNYPVTLTATDGLDKLQGREFSKSFDASTVITTSIAGSKYAPINHIRAILQESWGINNGMPINWMCNLRSEQYPDSDALSGLNKLDALRYLRDYANKDCDWYLTNIMKSLRCWIRQYNGSWWIINYDDLITNDGVFNGWRIGVEPLVEDIEAESYILDLKELVNVTMTNDGYEMLKKPISKVSVEYNAVVRDDGNVVPDFDFNSISEWYDTSEIADLTLNNFDLSDRDGKSLNAKVPNIVEPGDPTWITFGQTYLDTNVLFKKATLGFLWNPIAGYDLDADDYIDFSKNPLSIRVSFDVDGVTYYLNEFGFWSDKNIPAKGEIVGQTFVPAPPLPFRYKVDFDGVQGFEPGDRFNFRSVTPGGAIHNMSYTFTTTESTTTGIDKIVSSLGGSRSGDSLEIFAFVRGDYQMVAWMDKEDNYYRTINIEEAPKLKLADILSVQFQSKGKSPEIKLPMMGDNAITSGKGRLSIMIKLPRFCEMNLDDVYFRVGEYNDVYEVNNGLDNSSQKYDLEISSSFNGHFNSSYMDSYRTSNNSMLWTGSNSLTSHYAIQAMLWLDRPNKIFQGSIPKIIGMNKFIELDGNKYISLGNSINCHTNQTKVLLFEAKKSSSSFSVVHKSSKDN